LVVTAVAVVVMVGCGGGGGCGCDLPRRANDWLIAIDFSGIPDEVVDYPVFVNTSVRVTHFETGRPAPDGIFIYLAIAPGNFEGDDAEVEIPAANGRVDAAIEVNGPGRYTLTVTVSGGGIPVTSSFNVGP
jgi:hypothetical protein